MDATDELLPYLRLMQLADSALPIGAASHSFGMETLAADSSLTPENLHEFFEGYLREAGLLEAVFCREGYRLTALGRAAEFESRWIGLNHRLSAMKPAREGRTASATLGRRFLQLVLGLEEHPRLLQAFYASKGAGMDLHLSPAFGLVGAALGVSEAMTVSAYMQQSLTGLVSACQRLMPVGQRQAMRLLWNLKTVLIKVMRESGSLDVEEVSCFTPLVEVGGMRHPMLSTRLFIS